VIIGEPKRPHSHPSQRQVASLKTPCNGHTGLIGTAGSENIGQVEPKNEQIFGFLWKKPLLCEVELHKTIYYERKTDL